MAYTKAVWILDGSFYLDYLNDSLSQLKADYPWLAKPVERYQHGVLGWDWRTTKRRTSFQLSSRRDALLDWIIREEIQQHYFLPIANHIHVHEFQRIHMRLHNDFDLSSHTFRYLLIPRFYGDAECKLASRVDGSIFLELELEPILTRHHGQ